MLDHLPLLVRETRRRRGLSIRAAAAEIDGVTFSTMTRFEHGGNCHLDHAAAMLRWVGDARQAAPTKERQT